MEESGRKEETVMRKRVTAIKRNVILAVIGQILLLMAAGMILKMD